MVFHGHRRFLDQRHKFRLNKVRFDGQQEMRNPPKTLSGHQILAQIEEMEGKKRMEKEREGNDKNESMKRKRKEKLGKRTCGGQSTQSDTQQWEKKSIFFELPYWKDNLLRHNLDMMHIEKNVCDNIIFTLLNDSKKSKDHVNARKDLEDMCIRPDLWPNDNGRISPAVFTLTGKGKRGFLTTLKNIRVPDGYSSNISRCIEPYPSQNLDQIFSNDTSHIQLARMTTDDDPQTSNANDNFD